MKKVFFFLLAVCIITVFAVGCQRTPGGQPADESRQFAGFSSVEEAAASDAWKDYFPNQYTSYMKTSDMSKTKYGGSGVNGEKIDYLELYPFLKTTYAGFPFSVSYYRSRGHVYSIEDTMTTGRLSDLNKRAATCLACKSTDVVVLQEHYGDEWYKKSFAEVAGSNYVGCLDCHSKSDASVTYQRSYLTTALNLGTFRNISPEGRSDLTCAQCHVNYHFNPQTRAPEMPWSISLTVEDQLAHYNQETRFNDEWEHAITGALVAKVQHPEYEMFHEGQIQSVHSKLGMGCNDCHMPTRTDANGNSYTSHQITSPLKHVEDSCFRCHSGWGKDGIISRAEAVQKSVYDEQNRLGYKLEEFIIAVGNAIENGTLSGEKLQEVQAIHREAQFYWDFVWVENSNGFHNWQEALRILNNVEALINKAMALL